MATIKVPYIQFQRLEAYRVSTQMPYLYQPQGLYWSLFMIRSADEGKFLYKTLYQQFGMN